MEYAEHLETALVDFEQDGRLDTLLVLLGCRHMAFAPREHVWKLVFPEQPDAILEPVVAETLRKLLSTMDQESGDSSGHTVLLDGLCQRGRWRTCLLAEVDTYNLADALLRYAITDSTAYPDAVTRTIRDDVHTVLRDWLGISVQNGMAVPMQQIVRTLFGEVWWDLVAAANEPLGEVGLRRFIYTTRPAFLPGVVPAQDARSSGLELPEMVTSP